MLLRLLKISFLTIIVFLASPSLGSQDPIRASEPYSGGPDTIETSSQSTPTRANGMIMLDYEVIPIEGYAPIDLLGFHFYKQFTNWLYLGVGLHAPLVRGDYGGFMVFDVSIHAQQRLFWNLFADAGASLGGGGGGNSVEQSKIISGTGGFQKSYIGLGYDFTSFSAGVNLSRIRFAGSAIHNSQLDFYIQVPFSYYVGSYANSGDSLPSAQNSGRGSNFTKPTENSIAIGLDNIIQIKPEGSYRETINLVDVQFIHFMTDRGYVFFEGGVGYHGLPMYNQVFGGIGYKYSYSPRVNVRSQLGLGSGGYAPEKINTGSGLLLYPKLSAEYLLSNSLGISLSSGYLYAPTGSSRNLTLGASLNYHDSPEDSSHVGGDATTDVKYRGYRFHIFEQAEFSAKVGDGNQGTVKLLSVQIDNIIHKNFYVPFQLSAAYNEYLGYPGYGELLAGVGVQNEYTPRDPFQTFAQILVGANVNGIVVKPGAGINYGLSDQLAIYGQVGGTFSVINTSQHPNQKFRSPTVGLGLSYRFSLPHR
jgi:hypothetical protein